MSLDELRALRAQVDREIKSYAERKRREALAAVEQAAREHGFALADLTSGRGRRRGLSVKTTGEAKYANPEDSSQTWSGRGRRPRWVTEQIDAGRSLEDLAL